MPILQVATPSFEGGVSPSGLQLSVGLDLIGDDGERVSLRRGRGVLFARGVRDDPLGQRQPRGLLDPSPFVAPDGTLGVVACRVTVESRQTDAITIHLRGQDGAFRLIELPLAALESAADARRPSIRFDADGPRLVWESSGMTHVAALTNDYTIAGGRSADANLGAQWSQQVTIDARLADELELAFGEFPHPVLAEHDDETLSSFPFIPGRADPSVVHWNGRWLFIATDEYFAERPDESGLLIRMADTVEGLRDAPDHRILGPGGELRGCFWAPELHEIAGSLWCLFAPSIGTTEWTGVQCWMMRLADGGDPTNAASWLPPQAAVSQDGGPLQLDAEHPGISLDMTYFASAGRHYLVWSQRILEPVLGDAELWIAEIDDTDPTRLISAASRIAVPELSWELDGANVVEAPFVIARDGRIHLTYSASAVGPSYAVGELVADVGDDLLDPSSWRKSPFPLLDSDPSTGQWGPGHSMFARVGETDLVVYHALAAPSATIRDSAIRPVRFGANGRLVLDARSGRAEGVQGG